MINHFLLEIVSSRQMVSEMLVSNSVNLLTINPSLTKTILPPPCLFLSLLKGGNWKPSILNCWSGKESSSFVSSTQIISKGIFFKIYLNESI